MIRTSLFLSTLILLVAGMELLDRLHFLAPCRKILFLQYGTRLGGFLLTLGLSLFSGILALHRKFFLKDTGRKLTHVDNQLQAEGTELLPLFPGGPR